MVITGETIDKKLYDYLNSYTAEKGSDGVVRVAATNMNYRHIKIKQNVNSPKLIINNDDELPDVYPLELNGAIKSPPQRCAMEILPLTSHSGKDKGIMRSVTKRNSANKLVVKSIIECLQVTSAHEYEVLTNDMIDRTEKIYSPNKYVMIVVRVTDDQGNEISDYDLLLLAGNEYRPDKLPKGFFVDRQKNRTNSCHLTYYLNNTKMSSIPDGKIGFRVIARPTEGFVYYSPGEFRSEAISVTDLLKENETIYLDIELKRHVDKHTFVIETLTDKDIDFKDAPPDCIDIE